MKINLTNEFFLKFIGWVDGWYCSNNYDLTFLKYLTDQTAMFDSPREIELSQNGFVHLSDSLVRMKTARVGIPQGAAPWVPFCSWCM